MTQRTFELGLALAGAVSGGAYTAGFVSFLLEALAEWEKERVKEGTPDHHVVLRAMSATSSGGICAALTVLELGTATPGSSPLEEAWSQIDIASLLTTTDLEGAPVVRSLLNGDALDRIVTKVRPRALRPSLPPFVSPKLDVILTSTNLRGVQYDIAFKPAQSYAMRTHADFWRATVDATTLPAQMDDLFAAALATSAVPIGLRARLLERSKGEYTSRTWEVPYSSGGGTGALDVRPVAVPPVWPVRPSDPPGMYPSLNVDGGLLDNEPFELVRQVLTPTGHAPRSAQEADRAVIMVNPFPEVAPDNPAFAEDSSLTRVIAGTFRVLLDQPKFKNEEIALAQDPDVYTRYLVAPRRAQGEKVAAAALASGSFAHFGGFLAKSFRDHDFALGRRNGQQFLRETFTVAPTNPVVAGRHRWPSLPASGELPLVPLYGSAAIPIDLPRWPYDDLVLPLDPVLDAVSTRAAKIAPLLSTELFKSAWPGRIIWPLVKRMALSRLRELAEAELTTWTPLGRL